MNAIHFECRCGRSFANLVGLLAHWQVFHAGTWKARRAAERSENSNGQH